MNQWIKLYIEALHDRKLRKLSRFDKSVFYDLLLLAGQDGKGGQLPGIEDIALELDLKVTEAKKSLEHLIQMGLIEVINDNLTIHNFQKRQESNLTGAERVARYRSNKRDNADVTQERYTCNADDNADVTDERYNGNENVTVDKDKEIDKEEDKELREVKESVLKNARATKTPAPKPEKHQYGSFGNVLLTDAEADKLRERFIDADQRIEYFSTKKKAKGYTYKSDYAAILAWADDDAEKQKTAKKSPASVNEYPDIYTMLQAEAAQ